jgi:16S rRNA (adenine1518-N6/adenine1519-N6)-dimethyltransferase
LLREEIPDWAEAAAAVGFEPRTRAEQLSLEQWIALSERSRSRPPTAADSAASERFPIVDENDHLLGDAPRGKVHGDNLRHRAVHLFIFNRQGELFLQKRSRWKDRHPLLWDSSAAGHVEAGEKYDETAVRELKEELGVTAELARVVKLPASERTGEEFIWLYRGEHEGPFQLAKAEIEHGEFFSVDIVTRWVKARPDDFAPGFLECWQAFNHQGAPVYKPPT